MARFLSHNKVNNVGGIDPARRIDSGQRSIKYNRKPCAAKSASIREGIDAASNYPSIACGGCILFLFRAFSALCSQSFTKRALTLREVNRIIAHRLWMARTSSASRFDSFPNQGVLAPQQCQPFWMRCWKSSREAVS